MASIAWGTVSEWFSGVASFSAVAIALIFSSKSSRIERDTRYKAVYAWSEHNPVDETWELVIDNSTNYPIYQWLAQIRWRPDGQDSREVDKVDSDRLGIIPPGKNRYQWVPSKALHDSESQVHVTLIFRDATGTVCHRLSNGHLRKGKRNEAKQLKAPIK